MNISLIDITIALAIFLIAALLWQNFKIRELAFLRAKQQCEKLDLQILDESVYGFYWRPVFKQGQIRIKRRFRFYFTTTGEQRYQGELELIGRQQAHIEFAPHRVN